jgi:hypothetical protein
MPDQTRRITRDSRKALGRSPGSVNPNKPRAVKEAIRQNPAARSQERQKPSEKGKCWSRCKAYWRGWWHRHIVDEYPYDDVM